MTPEGKPNRPNSYRWQKWLATRPPIVRELAERLPPWNLYRMKSTGHRIYIRAYGEDGTLRVVVDPAYNCVVFGREVFGVSPDNLEPCEPPEPGELVGSPQTGFSRAPKRDGSN